MESLKGDLARLQEKIGNYDKENLEEMLFAVAEGIYLVTHRKLVRIYLEDLTGGALSCAYTSHPAAAVRDTPFPIVSSNALVSTVFATQAPREVTDTARTPLPLDRELNEKASIAATCLLPITSQGRSIGLSAWIARRRERWSRTPPRTFWPVLPRP